MDQKLLGIKKNRFLVLRFLESSDGSKSLFLKYECGEYHMLWILTGNIHVSLQSWLPLRVFLIALSVEKRFLVPLSHLSQIAFQNRGGYGFQLCFLKLPFQNLWTLVLAALSQCCAMRGRTQSTGSAPIAGRRCPTSRLFCYLLKTSNLSQSQPRQ